MRSANQCRSTPCRVSATMHDSPRACHGRMARCGKMQAWVEIPCFPRACQGQERETAHERKEAGMQLVSRVGVIVLWIVLVGVPSTGRAALARRPDPVAEPAVQQYVSVGGEMAGEQDNP